MPRLSETNPTIDESHSILSPLHGLCLHLMEILNGTTGMHCHWFFFLVVLYNFPHSMTTKGFVTKDYVGVRGAGVRKQWELFSVRKNPRTKEGFKRIVGTPHEKYFSTLNVRFRVRSYVCSCQWISSPLLIINMNMKIDFLDRLGSSKPSKNENAREIDHCITTQVH